MKNVGVVAASLAVGCWLVACSTRSSLDGRSSDAAAGQGRDLHLATDPATPPAATVSDLESGRLPKPRQLQHDRVVTRQAAPRPDGDTKVEAPMAGLATAPEATSSVSAPVATPAATSVAPAEDVVEIRGKGTAMEMPSADGYYPVGAGFGGFGPRDRTVIIRGGRGGPFDDCDLGHGGLHGHHGVAINRLTPAPIGIR